MKLLKLVLAYAIFFCNTPAQNSALDFRQHKPTANPAHKGISIRNAHSPLKSRTPKVVIVALPGTG